MKCNHLTIYEDVNDTDTFSNGSTNSKHLSMLSLGARVIYQSDSDYP